MSDHNGDATGRIYAKEDTKGERMSDEDIRAFRALLRKFCEVELDQWELWRVDTRFGPVFIDISRVSVDGTSPDAYDII